MNSAKTLKNDFYKTKEKLNKRETLMYWCKIIQIRVVSAKWPIIWEKNNLTQLWKYAFKNKNPYKHFEESKKKGTDANVLNKPEEWCF